MSDSRGAGNGRRPALDTVVEVFVGPDAVSVGQFRVDDGHRDLVVLEPLPDVDDRADVADPVAGDVVQLRWSAQPGAMLARAQVVRIRAGEPWWLLVGEAAPARRRRDERRRAEGMVLLSRSATEDPWIGHLVDVAVGGLRCRMPDSAACLQPGDPVWLRVDLDRRRHAVRGRVARAGVSRRIRGQRQLELAVVFDEPLAAAAPPVPLREARRRARVPRPR